MKLYHIKLLPRSEWYMDYVVTNIGEQLCGSFSAVIERVAKGSDLIKAN